MDSTLVIGFVIAACAVVPTLGCATALLLWGRRAPTPAPDSSQALAALSKAQSDYAANVKLLLEHSAAMHAGQAQQQAQTIAQLATVIVSDRDDMARLQDQAARLQSQQKPASFPSPPPVVLNSPPARPGSPDAGNGNGRPFFDPEADLLPAAMMP